MLAVCELSTSHLPIGRPQSIVVCIGYGCRRLRSIYCTPDGHLYPMNDSYSFVYRREYAEITRSQALARTADRILLHSRLSSN